MVLAMVVIVSPSLRALVLSQECTDSQPTATQMIIVRSIGDDVEMARRR